jgi:hypothetical protein
MIERAKLLAVLAGAAGGAIAIGAMEFFSARAAYPLMAIPFATSIVMVMGSPQAEPAQPRALIGGHLVSTLAGLMAVKLLGPAPWVAALAVGIAMIANASHRYVSSAGWDRPVGGRGQRPVLGLLDRAGRRRRAAARVVRLRLAQRGRARPEQGRHLAGALVVITPLV